MEVCPRKISREPSLLRWKPSRGPEEPPAGQIDHTILRLAPHFGSFLGTALSTLVIDDISWMLTQPLSRLPAAAPLILIGWGFLLHSRLRWPPAILHLNFPSTKVPCSALFFYCLIILFNKQRLNVNSSLHNGQFLRGHSFSQNLLPPGGCNCAIGRRLGDGLHP